MLTNVTNENTRKKVITKRKQLYSTEIERNRERERERENDGERERESKIREKESGGERMKNERAGNCCWE